MDAHSEVLRLLDEVLGLGGRGLELTAESRLLGAMPELDSMAVVAILTSLEDRFGIVVDDDEVDGEVFASVGTLTAFVQGKLAA